MWNKIKRFFWLLVCEADEKYPDLTRLGLIVALISAIGMAVYSVVWLAQTISFSDLCTGLSALLFGGGTAIGVRAKLEDGTIFKPKPRDEDEPPTFETEQDKKGGKK